MREQNMSRSALFILILVLRNLWKEKKTSKLTIRKSWVSEVLQNYRNNFLPDIWFMIRRMRNQYLLCKTLFSTETLFTGSRGVFCWVENTWLKKATGSSKIQWFTKALFFRWVISIEHLHVSHVVCLAISIDLHRYESNATESHTRGHVNFQP